MSRESLIALHAAFREASTWPDPVRETVVRWLADAVRRKRRSPHPAPAVTASQPAKDWPEAWRPPLRQAQEKQRRSPKPKPKPLRPHKPDRSRILEHH